MDVLVPTFTLNEKKRLEQHFAGGAKKISKDFFHLTDKKNSGNDYVKTR